MANLEIGNIERYVRRLLSEIVDEAGDSQAKDHSLKGRSERPLDLHGNYSPDPKAG